MHGSCDGCVRMGVCRAIVCAMYKQRAEYKQCQTLTRGNRQQATGNRRREEGRAPHESIAPSHSHFHFHSHSLSSPLH